MYGTFKYKLLCDSYNYWLYFYTKTFSSTHYYVTALINLSPCSVPMPKLNNELLLLIMVFWHTKGDFVIN